MIALMTIQLEFTPDIQAALNQERYDYPDPIVQRRMETLWLKSHDLPHVQIAELAGVSENTMRDYFRALWDFAGYPLYVGVWHT